MAKVILENTREHDITLSALDTNGELVQITIPSARQSTVDREQLVNGVAEADDSFLDAVKQKSKAVAAYFDEGWLVVSTPSAAEKKTAAAKKQDTKE